MATLIQKFQTQDGRIFNSAADADAHESYLGKQGAVEAFIEKSGLKMAQAGLIRKHAAALVDFLASDEAAEAQAKFEADLAAAAAEPKPKRTKKVKVEEATVAE